MKVIFPCIKKLNYQKGTHRISIKLYLCYSVSVVCWMFFFLHSTLANIPNHATHAAQRNIGVYAGPWGRYTPTGAAASVHSAGFSLFSVEEDAIVWPRALNQTQLMNKACIL